MNLDFPVYQVIVVGFHHKKGCQIEYAFPPLERELEKTAWKYLPTLAMPDGAHNFQHDTVYFHLPSLTKPNETVFGVACYQQIDTEKLKIKADDVTRSTVQKSVCVLSKYPLYGHIQVKMQLITAAYFREGDFSQVSILEEAFHNLNACLEPELLRTPEAFVGLSPRELVFLFRHQILTLFKLLLLEKKVLFRGASVGPLCSALLTLISLLPLQLEYGLSHSACIRTAKTLSMVPQFSTESQNAADLEDALHGDKNRNVGYAEKPRPPAGRSQVMSMSSEKHQTEDNVDHANSSKRQRPKLDLDKEQRRKEHCDKSAMELDTLFTSFAETVVECGNPYNLSGEKSNATPSPPYSPAEPEVETPEKCVEVPDFQTAVEMTPSDAGLPLSLFTKGYLCHPYLSLHYMDLLTDARVRGFVIGTTNVLFKQKKDLVDVIVEMEDGSIEFMDPNLKRQLGLTTPDMRFADNVVKQVLGESGSGGGWGGDGESFMDGVGYEGGDEWIRAQFKYYLMSLMRTSLSEESSRQRESFGVSYLHNWQDTNNWRVWSAHVNSEERKTPGIYSLCPGHPFEGAMSVQDMKIRLAHTMQNTEGGRRLNQAVVSTGKAMAQTGKAVGGAISTAKGALSSWWNTVTTPVAAEVSAPEEPRTVSNSPVSPVVDSNRQ